MYLYYVPGDPLLEKITSCWKFTKKQPTHVVKNFDAIVEKLIAGDNDDDVSADSYENDFTNDSKDNHANKDDATTSQPNDVPIPRTCRAVARGLSLNPDSTAVVPPLKLLSYCHLIFKTVKL